MWSVALRKNYQSFYHFKIDQELTLMFNIPIVISNKLGNGIGRVQYW